MAAVTMSALGLARSVTCPLGRQGFAGKAPARRRRTPRAAAQLRTEAAKVQTAASVSDRSTPAETLQQFTASALASGTLLAPWLLDAQAALAKDGELGILEGKSVALLHPLFMGTLFALSLQAAYLGWQWRRVRTIGTDISSLKAQLPAKSQKEGEESKPHPLEAEITKLTEERKALTKGNFRERHYNVGSILLGSGVLLGIEGAANTYARTGKLFPGPHLYAGAGIVVLWAMAAALVPAMSKGNDNARNAHIALNVLNIGLFTWQIPTGFEIVQKVFQFAPWP
eukprot:jgi/Chlat1/297/Chrsp1S03178